MNLRTDVAARLDNVRAVTRALLPLGYPTIARVSAALETSTRPLQRRLHEVDRTYSQLVDECRLAVARPLLEESSIRLAEIFSPTTLTWVGSGFLSNLAQNGKHVGRGYRTR